MDTYTVTLTRNEMDMLVEATNIMHIRYSRPGMTEAAKKGAQEYADLCSQLYQTMIEQDDRRAKRTASEKLKLMQEIEERNNERWGK